MKNIIIALVAVVVTVGLISFTTSANTSDNTSFTPYEFKVITAVESIVPMGLGRSRIIENTESINVADATTTRIDGKDSYQGNVKRRDLKIDSFKETKMLNFYSGVGINFQNIASNDAMVASKMNEMMAQGWELVTIVGGVESDAGDKDGNGIFITRYYYKRLANK